MLVLLAAGCLVLSPRRDGRDPASRPAVKPPIALATREFGEPQAGSRALLRQGRVVRGGQGVVSAARIQRKYAAAVHHEHQALRHRAHHQLMQAFHEPEIYDGTVTLKRPTGTRSTQLRLENPD